jgi:hypothetical protein
MNFKTLILRVAVVAILLAGAAIYTHPTQAASCLVGSPCLNTDGEQGVCGSHCGCKVAGSANNHTDGCKPQ